MAIISFSRPVLVNPDWGLKNLESAMAEEGTHELSEERMIEINRSFNAKITPKMKELFYKNYGYSKK